MATLPKVLIKRADYQIGGDVALRLRIQGLLTWKTLAKTENKSKARRYFMIPT